MGCFDTLVFPCPNCGKGNEFQSKAHKCDMRTYTIARAPLSVIADAAEDGEAGRLSCGHCSVKLELLVQRIVQVVIKEEEEGDPYD